MKIGLVIQRFGREVLGGSELLAFKMAQFLSEHYQLEVITTTAKHHLTWENYWQEGEYVEEGILIKRFKVDFPRSSYWHTLNQLLLKDASSPERLRNLPLNFCFEWIKHQGPYSTSFLNYLRKKPCDYYFFFTYLYPTTFFGIDVLLQEGVSPDRLFLIPTYHPEPPAHLPIFLKYQQFKHLFLTTAEAELSKRLYGVMPEHEILGFGLEDKYSQFSSFSKENFVIYAGRLEAAKGVPELIDYFSRFYKKYKNVKLYLIGKGEIDSSLPEGIIYKGFVEEEEKFRLLRQAKVLIHPSPFESLGIVLLEAFMRGTPALVNSRCEVLAHHVKTSGAGAMYGSYQEFESNLLYLLKEENQEILSKKARAYYLANYSIKIFKSKLLSLLSSQKG